MQPKRYPKDKAKLILEKLQKEIPNFSITKSRGKDAIYVTLPREKVKSPVSANHSKDYISLEVVVNLAQRMATLIVRETMGEMVNQMLSKLSNGLVDELIKKMPTQQVVIQKVASEATEKLKTQFKADTHTYMPTNFDNALELVGKTGKTKSSTEDLDSILDVLEGKS